MGMHDARRERLKRLSVLKFIGASWGDIQDQLCGDKSLTSHSGAPSLKTLKNDWADKDEWLREVWDFDDPESVAETVIAEKQRLKHKTWRLIRDLENSDDPNYSTILGMLRFVNDLGTDEVEMLQSLGEVEKEPDKVEHEVDIANVKEKLNRRLSQGTTQE